MHSNVLEDSVGDVLYDALSGADGNVIIVNPSHDAISSLVSVIGELSDPTHVRLFAAREPLKDLMDDFLIASAVADLIESGVLSVRTLQDVPNSSLVLSGESLVSLVESRDQAAGLAATDESFVEAAYDDYDERWADAPEFTLRTPPRSRVMDTLEEDLGPQAAADFEAILESLETARGDGDGLDEVTISLLVAAKNGELLYDISKWGEDVGVASKATFSRTKTRLEEQGLVATEKVPIDVGRPRLRLLLGSQRLEDADADELAGIAQEMLA
ncbi:transcriptional regulator TbsP [Salinibaculum salinum]|uniref:transcriptional regulator TbsP n=1 Tax=Salinibaculum salinum TaxID=3131996 RepID=UPI003A981DC2